MSTKHTPLPWRVLYLSDAAEIRSNGCCVADLEAGSFLMGDGTGRIVSVAECHANAELIVTAVNSHYDLVEACKFIIEWLGDEEMEQDDSGYYNKAFQKALKACRAALKKAQGGE